MLKEIFATFLLINGCSSGNLNNIHARYFDSDNSNPIVRTQPLKANENTFLSGFYNFRDEYDFNYEEYHELTDFIYEFDIDMDFTNSCPITYQGELKFLRVVEINYLVNPGTATPQTLRCHVRMTYGDEEQLDFATYTEWVFVSDLGLDSADNFLFQDCVFSINNGFLINPTYQKVWNSVFTSADNQYVITYNGYFNFNTNFDSYDEYVAVVGSVVMDNRYYYGLGTTDFACNCVYFNSEDLRYHLNTYTLPFNMTKVASRNIWFNGVKLQRSTFRHMSSVGLFSYVRDTNYDNTDFHDLLFTIVDVPVYFISSFFNFELFGMNLAVAFAGLVTLAVMLFVVKKIWSIF